MRSKIDDHLTFTPSEFVAVFNQTVEYAYPLVKVIGELSEFKVAKNRWIYADLKDDAAKLRIFGIVYQLPGPLEDGMLIEIIGEPRLHPQFGFSITIRSMRPVGEGSIKKAATLLQAKLAAEGLFAEERKRPVTVAPEKIGLIASEQSAAYADFIKILNARWGGVEVQLYDAQVQGEAAPESLVAGVSYFNQSASELDVIVMIRGGGSADDLSAFSTEQVTRAVAASRLPIVVAVGHEIDISLAELAADLRASTPSNAAELLFPDKKDELKRVQLQAKSLDEMVSSELRSRRKTLQETLTTLTHQSTRYIELKLQKLHQSASLLESFHPKATLKRGFAIVQTNDGQLIRSVQQMKPQQFLRLTLQDGHVKTTVKEVE